MALVPGYQAGVLPNNGGLGGLGGKPPEPQRQGFQWPDFSDPLAMMGLAMISNGSPTVGAPRPFMATAPQAYMAGVEAQSRKREEERLMADRAREEQSREQLAQYAVQTVHPSLRSLAQTQPDVALKLNEQYAPAAPDFGFTFAPDGSLIRTDKTGGGFDVMGQFAEPAGSDLSAAEERINRLADNLMQTGDIVDPQQARNVAVGIVDGRLRADRHPTTGQLQVVDMATGQPAFTSPAPPVAAPSQPQASGGQYGEPYPAADQAFGVEGAVVGGINQGMDALGVGAPFTDVQQTQASFNVLRESLMNDISSAYNRQPPSWLMQEIRDLTPSAGNPLEGAGSAQRKLSAIGRHLSNELAVVEQSLATRTLSPKVREELESRAVGLRSGITRIDMALGSFGGQQPAGAGATDAADPAGPAPDGIDPADWQYMTPEERALFQ